MLVPDLAVHSGDVDVILRRGFELMYLDTRLLVMNGKSSDVLLHTGNHFRPNKEPHRQ